MGQLADNTPLTSSEQQKGSPVPDQENTSISDVSINEASKDELTKDLEKPSPEELKKSADLEKISEIAKIQSIDIETALFNVNRNESLLVNLFSNFIKDYEGANKEIIEALEADNTDFAQYKLHTLKGLTGTLGAKQLSEATENLEKIITDAEKPIDSALAQFDLQFIELLSGLQRAGLEAPQSATSGTGKSLSEVDLDIKLILEIAERLRGLLGSGSTTSSKDLVLLQKELDGAASELVAELADSVDNYDFDDALIALDKLETQLRAFVSNG